VGKSLQSSPSKYHPIKVFKGDLAKSLALRLMVG